MRLGAKRYICMKESKRKRCRRWFGVGFFSVAICAALVYCFSVMRPAFAVLAENRAREIAVRTIHQAVADAFSEDTAYEDIVDLERTDNNKISAVKSNLSLVNQLKSKLNLEIQDRISALNKTEMNIPFGSLSGNDMFAGIGPDISFQIRPYGGVTTDITTDFIEAGINQTRCDVTVKVKADVSILMPTMHKKSTVETSVPVLQTVIVGDVPQSFTHVDRDGHEFEDDVLQLAE